MVAWRDLAKFKQKGLLGVQAGAKRDDGAADGQAQRRADSWHEAGENGTAPPAGARAVTPLPCAAAQQQTPKAA